MQRLPERTSCLQPHVFHSLVETGDRPTVHLLMRAVAAVDAYDGGLVSMTVGIGSGAAERLGPVGCGPFAVLRMESVARANAEARIARVIPDACPQYALL